LWTKDNRFTNRAGKADAVELAEGSSPGSVKASVPDATGVVERGMYSQG